LWFSLRKKFPAGCLRYNNFIHNVTDQRLVVYKARRLLPYLLEQGFEAFPVWLGYLSHESVLPIQVTIYAANLQKPGKQVLTLSVRIVQWLKIKHSKPSVLGALTGRSDTIELHQIAKGSLEVARGPGS
jgi:hypothetical protein